MAKARNTFERMASDAAARLDKVRASGEQLSLLPDEPGRTPAEAAELVPAKGGRPKGATSKHNSQLRQWLAERGYRLPEEQLARIAGLASSEDAAVAAMRQTEAVLAWAFDGATTKDGDPRGPSAEQRLATYLQLYTVQLRAVEALLPYGLAKASPDVAVSQAVTLVLPGGSGADGAAQPVDVTPQRDNEPRDLVPADVRWQMQQNQGLSETHDVVSDNGKSDE